MEKVLNYLEQNYDKTIEELKEYISIPSISTGSEHKADVRKCAEFVASKLTGYGAENVKIIDTEGHPLVYGDWMHAGDAPTVLVYGHYDVQPVDPIELWDTPPFEATVKDGKLYARGADDNKGQNFVHMKSFEAFMKTEGKLPVNIKFIIEGEEEIGSPNLEKFLATQQELLKCDAVLISDTSMYAADAPTVSYGLRGLAYLEVELTGPNRDLHSGSFGGSVANPINELARVISKLIDEDGVIQIPGFYDDVLEMTQKELDNIKKLDFNDEEYAKELEVNELKGEKGFSTLARLWARPTLDCNGIYGGYTGEGAKTVLPSKATAKISMRLVPNQKHEKIAEMFTEYVKSITPAHVKVKVTNMHGGKPVVIPLESKAIEAASVAVNKAFGYETVYTREGGSIPIVVEFVEQLKAPAVLMGLGLDSDNIHSPNEHFSLDAFQKGMKASAYFLEEFAKK